MEDVVDRLMLDETLNDTNEWNCNNTKKLGVPVHSELACVLFIYQI
jgi:hypothetical protein